MYFSMRFSGCGEAFISFSIRVSVVSLPVLGVDIPAVEISFAILSSNMTDLSADLLLSPTLKERSRKYKKLTKRKNFTGKTRSF